MTAISLRLPDNIEANLKAEALLVGKTPSEIARLAISEYLARREKERFMTQMVAEIQTAYANPAIANDAQALADDLVDEGLNALIAAELEAGIDPDEKWWC